jgi:hypothetical protein
MVPKTKFCMIRLGARAMHVSRRRFFFLKPVATVVRTVGSKTNQGSCSRASFLGRIEQLFRFSRPI